MHIIAIISELWKSDKLPIINGMAKSDGSFYELGEDGLHLSNPIDIDNRDYNEWFSYINATVSLNYLGFNYCCGCGSHGSEGWLLAINSNNEVDWLFFDYVNPFEKLWIEEDAIHVFSNLNVEWIFPINRPEEVYFVNCQL